MAQLSSKALKLLKDDEGLQIAIGNLFNPVRKIRTVKRWISEKDIRLTTLDAITIIKNKTGLTDEEILEEEPAIVL